MMPLAIDIALLEYHFTATVGAFLSGGLFSSHLVATIRHPTILSPQALGAQLVGNYNQTQLPLYTAVK